ncbi:MAG: DUF4326 domain-containing protein [Acidimicrobiia bacterium]|nr:MAG: DUF4326 domain-containing protein [Acidimicrobiia bacterium]
METMTFVAPGDPALWANGYSRTGWEIAGLDLGCWCREGTPCHGDTLLEAANA